MFSVAFISPIAFQALPQKGKMFQNNLFVFHTDDLNLQQLPITIE